MTVTATSFREAYPEFANTTTFPDSQVNYYITLGYKLLRPCKWQDVLDDGIMLFVAHNLALEAQAQKQAAAGGIPTGQVGLTAAKAVDKVSVSYDNSAAMEEGAGHWNLTIYGKRFWWLLRMAGAGAVQL